MGESKQVKQSSLDFNRLFPAQAIATVAYYETKRELATAAERVRRCQERVDVLTGLLSAVRAYQALELLDAG